MLRRFFALCLIVALAASPASAQPPPAGGQAPQPPAATPMTAVSERSIGLPMFAAVAGVVAVLLVVCYPSRRYD
jgi:hypothetical protein